MSLLQNGNERYDVWLKKLTPDEREKHLLERAIKKERLKQAKTIAQGYADAAQSKRNLIVAGLLNATLKQVEKANEGDTQAYVAVFDRHVAKPTSQVDVTSNGQTMSAPTIIFSEDVPDDWKHDE